MATKSDHTAQVTVYFGAESGHDIYIAECSCGWFGPQCDWKSEADQDRERHVTQEG